jgi:ubiquinone/menaquinone biosynthesis C-methylase UbiE
MAPSRRRRPGYFYPPGLLYDLAFGRMFRGLRKWVARRVTEGRLAPWLDVCCGTGDQLRRRGEFPGQARSLPASSSDPSFAESDPGAGGVGERNLGPAMNLAIGLDISLGFVRYAAAHAPDGLFVCGDAARLPFKDASMGAVSVSMGLHDKPFEVRTAILAEARRVLVPGGRLVAVDFERPWNGASRAGATFAQAIERLAGRDHYGNGRDFLRRGGLRAILRENGFAEVERRDIASGSIAAVVASRVEEAGL